MRRRWILVALALIAATAFLISVQMGRWWSVGDFEVGPFSSKRCFSGDCAPASLSWVGGTMRWQRAGMGTWAGGLFSAFGLVCVAAGLASKRRPRLLAKMSLVSIVTTALAGTLFIAQFPGLHGLSADRGLFVFFAAIVVGAITAVLALRTTQSPPAS